MRNQNSEPPRAKGELHTAERVEAGALSEQSWHEHAEKVLDAKNSAELYLAAFPFIQRKGELADWAERRTQQLLQTINYDKLIADIDREDESEEEEGFSSAALLMNSLAYSTGGIAMLHSMTKEIRSGKLFPVLPLYIKRVFQTVSLLEIRATQYEITPDQAQEQQVVNASRLLEDIARTSIIFREERAYASAGNPDFKLRHFSKSLGFFVNTSSELLMENPMLLNALQRKLNEQKLLLVKAGVIEADAIPAQNRKEKETDLLRWSSAILLMDPQTQEEECAIRNLTFFGRVNDVETESDYIINKLHRQVAEIAKRDRVDEKLQAALEKHPELNEERAIRILQDENHALEIFTGWSETISREKMNMISVFSDMAKRGHIDVDGHSAKLIVAGILGDHEEFTLDSPTWNPRQEKELKDIKTPVIGIDHLQAQEGTEPLSTYSYFDIDRLRFKLEGLQLLLGVPLGLIVKYIEVLPERLKEDAVSVQITNSEKTQFSYYVDTVIIEQAMHELGEQIVKQLPFDLIEKYAQIFMAAQASDYPFVTNYSATKWKKGKLALAIKEDLCEAISKFCSDALSNIELFKSSPEKHAYVLHLLTQYLDPAERDFYLGYMNDFIDRLGTLSQITPPKQALGWTEEEQQKEVHTVGRASASEFRIKTITKNRNLSVEELALINQTTIQVSIPALVITDEPDVPDLFA